MTPDQQIAQLQEVRLKIAALSQTLSERELAGRLLRLELEAELRTQGATKTAAETEAKAAPRYLDHARRSIQLEYDKAVAEAEAESLSLAVRWQIASLERVGI